MVCPVGNLVPVTLPFLIMSSLSRDSHLPSPSYKYKTMDAMIGAPQNRATYFKNLFSNGILVIKIPKTKNLKYMYFVNN